MSACDWDAVLRHLTHKVMIRCCSSLSQRAESVGFQFQFRWIQFFYSSISVLKHKGSDSVLSLSQADGQCITGWKASHLGHLHREQGMFTFKVSYTRRLWCQCRDVRTHNIWWQTNAHWRFSLCIVSCLFITQNASKMSVKDLYLSCSRRNVEGRNHQIWLDLLKLLIFSCYERPSVLWHLNRRAWIGSVSPFICCMWSVYAILFSIGGVQL